MGSPIQLPHGYPPFMAGSGAQTLPAPLPLWCNGSTSVFQTDRAGSVPASGSSKLCWSCPRLRGWSSYHLQSLWETQSGAHDLSKGGRALPSDASGGSIYAGSRVRNRRRSHGQCAGGVAGHSRLPAPRPDLLQGETIHLLQGRYRRRVQSGVRWRSLIAESHHSDASASGGCICSRAQNMAGSFQEAGACTGAVFRTANTPHAVAAGEAIAPAVQVHLLEAAPAYGSTRPRRAERALPVRCAKAAGRRLQYMRLTPAKLESKRFRLTTPAEGLRCTVISCSGCSTEKTRGEDVAK